jgi:hypothetical protein
MITRHRFALAGFFIAYFCGMAILLFLLLCVFACENIVYSQTAPFDTTIRNVKWDSLFAADKKHFKVDNSDPEKKRDYRIYFKNIHGEEGGMFDSVTYFDIDQDGKEDASVEFWGGGGSGHFVSYALFLQSNTEPILTSVGGGSAMEIRHHKDTLFIEVNGPKSNEPYPDCCPRELQRLIFHHGKFRSLPMKEIILKE